MAAIYNKSHPSYLEMAVDAIKQLKERKGSSRLAIFNYIVNKHHLESSRRAHLVLNKCLRAAVEKGLLLRKSGTGVNGRFQVVATAVKPKKAAKPKAHKSPRKALAGTAKTPKRTSTGAAPKPAATKKSAKSAKSAPSKSSKPAAAKKVVTPKKVAKSKPTKAVAPKKAAPKKASAVSKKPKAAVSKKSVPPAAQKA